MFCYNCGKQIPDDTKFCHYCGAAQDEAQSTPASAAPPPVQQVPPQAAAYQLPPQAACQSTSTTPPVQPQERVAAGIFGALLCSLAGVAVRVVLFKIGSMTRITGIIMPVISGIIMPVFTAWGYNHFGKVMSKKGLVISIFIMIPMIFEGSLICEILLSTIHEGFTFSETVDEILQRVFKNQFDTIHIIMSSSLRSHFFMLLIRQYAYAAVGVIFLAVNMSRSKRAAKKNK